MIEIGEISAIEIASIIDGELIGNNCSIKSISLDTREIDIKNSCFFALEGERYDGNAFIDNAIAKGVSIVVTNIKKPRSVSVIYVENVKIALGKLAKIRKSAEVVAVTGSVGKTSTKELIYSILKQKFKINKNLRNENNEIGVPITLLSGVNKEITIVEMGMRKIGDIDYLANISRPKISVITNCGTAHIGILKSEKNIFKAKTEILNYKPEYAIVPNEKKFRKINFNHTKPFFIGEGGDCFLTEFYFHNDGIEFSVKIKEKLLKKLFINSLSRANLNNVLYAISIAYLYNLDEQQIRKGIFEYKDIESRKQLKKFGDDITIIDDTYNACFESMKSGLDFLMDFSTLNNKIPIAVLGDMLELGKKGKQYHIMIGEYCKKLKLKKVYLFGENAKSINKVLKIGKIFANKIDLINCLFKELTPNHVVLVKASRKNNFEEIIKGLEQKLV